MKYNLQIFTNNVDEKSLNQIYQLLKEPAFQGQKVRIMPDVHLGLNCVVGFTSTLGDKVIPNVIGVDIGCGMLCVNLGKIDVDYESLDKFIKTNIPHGSAYDKKACENGDFFKQLYCYDKLTNHKRLFGSLGTLGGGNHFIEIDVDDEGNKYLVIHTGSRNLGTQVANIYQKMAIESCKNAGEAEKEEISNKLKLENKQDLIPDALKEISKKYAHKTKILQQLCYLEGYEMELYMHDMRLTQEFARKNREIIADKILKFLNVNQFDSFETIHNFIDEFNIVRKGSVPAYKGQKIIIPMNMRDGSLICVGLGNEEWNCSAPHGAGRIMSRSKAKETLSLDKFKKNMQGIFTTTATLSTIDESPDAYKPMAEIIEAIKPTCEIIKIIKPVYNFKSSE